MARLESNIIGLFEILRVESIEIWHLANLIYADCMTKPDRRNGGRVSAICRASNKSKFLKLERDLIHFRKDGWPDK